MKGAFVAKSATNKAFTGGAVHSGGAVGAGVGQRVVAVLKTCRNDAVPSVPTDPLLVAAVYTPKDFELNRIMADIVRIVDRAQAEAA